jgi:GGDEF domain-containing protein
MLGIIERTLLHGLRPAETLGRWGANEFLVLCHERTAEMLAAHARYLAGLAVTADFRWWGDRIPLSLSIGSAQAEAFAGAGNSTLSALLKQAQSDVWSSHAGHKTLEFRAGEFKPGEFKPSELDPSSSDPASQHPQTSSR